MVKKYYTLIGIEHRLIEKGILQRALAYEFSSHKSMLTIWYYDNLLQKTYMTISHTSRIHYYIILDGLKIVKRTAKELLTFLDEFLTEQLTWQDYKQQLTGVELNAFYQSTQVARLKRYDVWKEKRKSQEDI